MNDDPIDGRPLGPFANLRRRIVLTYRNYGLRTLAFRALTLPLRFTPLERRLRLRSHARDQELRSAVAWHREHGRPVDVVIPSYRDAQRVRALVRSIDKTVRRGMCRVIVSDDCSGAEHLAALRAIDGIDVLVESERNSGFAANVNRGLHATDPARDVVVLNSDVQALPGWLACLQYAARERHPYAGIVGAQLQYPDGRIQFAGTIRNRDQPQWFDHRYRFKPSDWGPAGRPSPSLAITGACMYVRRDVIERIGVLDERYAMAYEDVDWCLRAWQAGFGVLYFPAARLVHHESVTRGSDQGARELASQRAFWERWSELFDARAVAVHTASAGSGPAAPSGESRSSTSAEHARPRDGRLRIAYATEGTGVGGGHRDIFEHLNRLAARGHEVSLYTLDPAPEWFALQVPVHSFEDYDQLAAALAEVEAIKVATWWMTAGPVFRASVVRGLPVYFVQDIETSYYPDHEHARHAVLDSYRPEFRYMTISEWNRAQLRELGLAAELVPPGVDLDTFRVRPEVRRREDMVLALGRANPLKNLPLTVAAWKALGGRRTAGARASNGAGASNGGRAELCLFGVEPELAQDGGMAAATGVRYVSSPDDERVGELFSEATVFVQTSVHEGFALPPLEAMATGAAVVCTDAHGNRDFCVDGVNCLMPEPRTAAVSAAIARLLADPELRARLGAAGVETARSYAWERRIDALEAFLRRVAESRRMAVAGELP
ncbi:MAG TPA: glycosyltransferase [Solirubrobacteraceae bacterium]|nr:glycosyltransferase [Solirubrobacteraceae bacterium]